MRLIDADLLKEKAKDYFISPGGALKLIDDQPTAYDVEKVMERLKERKKRIESRKERDIINIVGKANAKVTVKEDIDIVKEGWVNEQ